VDRHCEERSDEAIHVAAKKEWIASRSLSSGAHSRDPLARNDGKIHLRIPATHCARAVHESFAQRGRGECRVPNAPAASCAKCRKHTSVATTVAPGSPGIPARDGFNRLFRALPGDRACLPPSLADCSANLTPASGRQDHTTSPSALAPFVRAKRLRCVLPRPSHPCPTSVTIAKRPFCVGRDGGGS
jgi:hypothetical protein